MADRARIKGESRFPYGVRRRDALKGKASGSPGGNKGHAPTFSVACKRDGCPTKGEDVACSIKGFRFCPSCGGAFPKMGWVAK